MWTLENECLRLSSYITGVGIRTCRGTSLETRIPDDLSLEQRQLWIWPKSAPLPANDAHKKPCFDRICRKDYKKEAPLFLLGTEKKNIFCQIINWKLRKKATHCLVIIIILTRALTDKTEQVSAGVFVNRWSFIILAKLFILNSVPCS